jgi:hypothetical protein
MFIEAVTAVHTTGINWASVTTIVASILGGMSIIIGIFAKLISNQITGGINKFRIDVVNSLDTRLTILEQFMKDMSAQTKRR